MAEVLNLPSLKKSQQATDDAVKMLRNSVRDLSEQVKTLYIELKEVKEALSSHQHEEQQETFVPSIVTVEDELEIEEDE